MTEPLDLLKFKEEKATYQARINCMNCATSYAASVPRGKLVHEANTPCPNCGCTQEQVNEYYNPRPKERA